MESSNNRKVALYLCVCFCLGGVAVGFNDDIVKPKWSPKYLYEKVYTIPAVLPKHRNLMLPSLPVVYNAPEPKKPMNTILSFYGYPGGAVSSDWIGPRLSKGFQLKKKGMYKRAGCVEMGGTCLFRSGFYGAMKLDCCAGTTCEKIKGNFLCIAENDYVLFDDENELEVPTEELYDDEILKK